MLRSRPSFLLVQFFGNRLRHTILGMRVNERSGDSTILGSMPSNTGVASSFKIVPIADAAAVDVRAEALDNVTVKPSLFSASMSPLTSTITDAERLSVGMVAASPGNTPPKSSALVGLLPLPVTDPIGTGADHVAQSSSSSQLPADGQCWVAQQ